MAKVFNFNFKKLEYNLQHLLLMSSSLDCWFQISKVDLHILSIQLQLLLEIDSKSINQKSIVNIGSGCPIFRTGTQKIGHVIHTDVGLTLETSALKSLYSGQFILSTQLIKPNYLGNQSASQSANLPASQLVSQSIRISLSE